MKIQIDEIVRDMTPEEEAKYFPPEPSGDPADLEDMERALQEMGVQLDGN